MPDERRRSIVVRKPGKLLLALLLSWVAMALALYALTRAMRM